MFHLHDKPLPKPDENPEEYALARTLEAILETRLAWRALLAALLTLERDKIVQKLGPESKEWFEKSAIPRVPTGKLKLLSQLLEELGYTNIVHKTSTALNLHDYQYHGPDPSGDLSKYPDRESAAKDIILLAQDVLELVSKVIKRRLGKLWSADYDREIEIIYKMLFEKS